MANPNNANGVPPAVPAAPAPAANGAAVPAAAAPAAAPPAAAPAAPAAAATAPVAAAPPAQNIVDAARHFGMASALALYGAPAATAAFSFTVPGAPPAVPNLSAIPPGILSAAQQGVMSAALQNYGPAPVNTYTPVPMYNPARRGSALNNPLPGAQQHAAKRQRMDPVHITLLDELMRCARDDPDDLWALAIKRAEDKGTFSDSELGNMRIIRDAARAGRDQRLQAKAAIDNRWKVDNSVVPARSGIAVAGTHVPALNNTATHAGAAAAVTAPGVVFPPDYQMPSAGPAFDPPIRPIGTFLEEVRLDMITAMRAESVPIRGLENPGALCYRNAVLTALLNTDRFLSFLQAHARRTMTLVDVDEVSHHLLTRLYHVAQAYWSQNGVHPMSRDGQDTYNKMATLFWRACKYNVDGTEMGDVSVSDMAARKQLPPLGSHPWHAASWVQVCRAGAHNGDGDGDGFGFGLAGMRHMVGRGGGGGAAASALDAMNSQQQDAAEFLDWLVEFAATQLYIAPERYAAAKSSDYFDGMFRTYITSRFVCGACLRPVRLRSSKVDRESSIKIHVGQLLPGEPPQQTRTARRTHTLQSYLAQYFNETLTDRRCERCKAHPTPAQAMRRVRRMQTAPEILNVHLMRTEFDGAFRPLKNHDVVDVPEFLDVTKYLEPHTFAPGAQVFYRLTAVVSHTGDDVRSGHYVSHVRARKHGAPSADAKHTYDDVRRVMRAARDRKVQLRAACAQIADDAADHMQRTGTPLPARELSARYAAAEAADSQWSRINDERVTSGVPFTRIVNTSPDAQFTPDASDWYDPVVLVYEKWVEKYVTDRATGKRVYRVPMNLPGMTQNPLHLRSLARSAATESQIRATAVADVRVPEQWPPLHITAPLPEIYRVGRGDYGIDADELGLVDLGEDSDDDDGAHGDGDGGARGKQTKKAKDRDDAIRHMEEFFGWGDYDPDVAQRAKEMEAKKAARLKKAAQQAQPAAGGGDGGAAHGGDGGGGGAATNGGAAAATGAAPVATNGAAATAAAAAAAAGNLRGGHSARHQQLRVQRRINHSQFSPYTPYTSMQRPSTKRTRTDAAGATATATVVKAQAIAAKKSRLGHLMKYIWGQ